MQYKVRYRPLERLGPDGWRRFSEEQQAALISVAVASRGDRSPAVDGGGKDGTPGGQQQYKIA
jgi:arginine-tRNA-protein transferase